MSTASFRPDLLSGANKFSQTVETFTSTPESNAAVNEWVLEAWGPPQSKKGSSQTIDVNPNLIASAKESKERIDDSRPEGTPKWEQGTEYGGAALAGAALLYYLYRTATRPGNAAPGSDEKPPAIWGCEGLPARIIAGLPVNAPASDGTNPTSLRQSLGLRPDASEQEVKEVMVKTNSKSLRQCVGLPETATDQEVSDWFKADNAKGLRRCLGLPPDATDQEVKERAIHDLRWSLGLPFLSTDQEVREKLDQLAAQYEAAERARAELEKQIENAKSKVTDQEAKDVLDRILKDPKQAVVEAIDGLNPGYKASLERTRSNSEQTGNGSIFNVEKEQLFHHLKEQNWTIEKVEVDGKEVKVYCKANVAGQLGYLPWQSMKEGTQITLSDQKGSGTGWLAYTSEGNRIPTNEAHAIIAVGREPGVGGMFDGKVNGKIVLKTVFAGTLPDTPKCSDDHLKSQNVFGTESLPPRNKGQTRSANFVLTFASGKPMLVPQGEDGQPLKDGVPIDALAEGIDGVKLESKVQFTKPNPDERPIGTSKWGVQLFQSAENKFTRAAFSDGTAYKFSEQNGRMQIVRLNKDGKPEFKMESDGIPQASSDGKTITGTWTLSYPNPQKISQNIEPFFDELSEGNRYKWTGSLKLDGDKGQVQWGGGAANDVPWELREQGAEFKQFLQEGNVKSLSNLMETIARGRPENYMHAAEYLGKQAKDLGFEVEMRALNESGTAVSLTINSDKDKSSKWHISLGDTVSGQKSSVMGPGADAATAAASESKEATSKPVSQQSGSEQTTKRITEAVTAFMAGQVEKGEVGSQAAEKALQTFQDFVKGCDLKNSWYVERLAEILGKKGAAEYALGDDCALGAALNDMSSEVGKIATEMRSGESVNANATTSKPNVNVSAVFGGGELSTLGRDADQLVRRLTSDPRFDNSKAAWELIVAEVQAMHDESGWTDYSWGESSAKTEQLSRAVKAIENHAKSLPADIVQPGPTQGTVQPGPQGMFNFGELLTYTNRFGTVQGGLPTSAADFQNFVVKPFIQNQDKFKNDILFEQMCVAEGDVAKLKFTHNGNEVEPLYRDKNDLVLKDGKRLPIAEIRIEAQLPKNLFDALSNEQTRDQALTELNAKFGSMLMQLDNISTRKERAESAAADADLAAKITELANKDQQAEAETSKAAELAAASPGKQATELPAPEASALVGPQTEQKVAEQEVGVDGGLLVLRNSDGTTEKLEDKAFNKIFDARRKAINDKVQNLRDDPKTDRELLAQAEKEAERELTELKAQQELLMKPTPEGRAFRERFSKAVSEFVNAHGKTVAKGAGLGCSLLIVANAACKQFTANGNAKGS